MQFGGGFDMGPSQFAGGGFIASQQADAGAGSSVAKRGGSRFESVRSVTIRQMWKDTAHADDDMFTVDGTEIHTVTLVGQIRHVEHQTTKLVYMIDDATGVAQVQQWLNDDEKEPDDFQAGQYVRVYGALRRMGGDKFIISYSIKRILDYNEVTMHFLQCIFQHLHLTRGDNAKNTTLGDATQTTAAGGFNSAAPAFGGMAASSTGYGQSSAMGHGVGNTSGMDPCTKDVLALFSTPESLTEVGLSVDQVVAKVGHKYPVQQIEQALESLASEAHVYTTTDERHFRSCTM